MEVNTSNSTKSITDTSLITQEKNEKVRIKSIGIESLANSSLKIFKFATLLRVAISLLINKLNVRKVAKGLTDNLRFGFAVTLLSLIQKSSRLLM